MTSCSPEPSSIVIMGFNSLAQLLAVTQAAAYVVARKKNDQLAKKNCVRKKRKNGIQKNKTIRTRDRRTVTQVYNCLGPSYFRKAYRMTFETFWILHAKLRHGIQMQTKELVKDRNAKRIVKDPSRKGHGRQTAFHFHNGTVHSSVRLACAIRYFAGGAAYDLMAIYGLSYSEVMNSVWIVVEAINHHDEFIIEYPSDHAKQEEIAAVFREKSEVDFDNCAGCIDGLLIWIHKPTKKEQEHSSTDAAKFLCSRKNKYGLNLQGVADSRGRILDFSIVYGGASSDCIAFEASNLWKRLEKGLLKPGLVLFGDNAYLNTPYMATPYGNVGPGAKDNYNYYHSQVSPAGDGGREA